MRGKEAKEARRGGGVLSLRQNSYIPGERRNRGYRTTNSQLLTNNEAAEIRTQLISDRGRRGREGSEEGRDGHR